jgi:hypothetical protein
MITSYGDETTSEQEVSSFLTPDEHAMAMISGAILSGMTIKKVEYI